MRKTVEVLAHFADDNINIVSVTFDIDVYKVIKQVRQWTDEEGNILFELNCSENTRIDLCLNKKELKWQIISAGPV